MPRFLFTTHDASGEVEVDSLDLQDLAAARTAALKILSRAATEITDHTAENLRLETCVYTVDRRPIYRITFTVRIEPPRH